MPLLLVNCSLPIIDNKSLIVTAMFMILQNLSLDEPSYAAHV